MKKFVFLGVIVALFALPSPAMADIIDLTGQNSSAFVTGSVGTVFVQQIDPRATGTGFIDPFLKYTKYEKGGAPTTEQAYNYDAATLDAMAGNDAYGSANWTHLLLASDLQTFGLNCTVAGCTETEGSQYWKFIVDIDQTGSSPLISLDQLVLYYSSSPTMNPGVTTNGTNLPTVPNLGTQFFNLGNNTLQLNYAWNTGSGSGDYAFYVPVAPGPYIYLYNAMGFYGGDFVNNNGPDEWWAVRGTPVPEPASMLLLGVGLVGLGGFARRRMRK